MSLLILKTQAGNYQTVETVDVSAIFTSPTFTGIPIVPTASSTTVTTQIASTEYVGLYSDNLRKGLTAMGSDIKGMTLGLSSPGATQFSLSDGVIYFMSVYINSSLTVTGIRFTQYTQGVYTGDNYNGVGLYSCASNGTLTLVASSTTDETVWKTTGLATKSVAFSTPYVASPGLYMVAFLYNSSAQTTAPVIYGGTSWSANCYPSFGFANSYKMYSSLAAQTSLPSTQLMSGTSNVSAPIFFILY